jgi:hypothetical protein
MLVIRITSNCQAHRKFPGPARETSVPHPIAIALKNPIEATHSSKLPITVLHVLPRPLSVRPQSLPSVAATAPAHKPLQQPLPSSLVHHVLNAYAS